MLTRKEVHNCPKDDHPFRENLGTQPLNPQKIFGNSKILTKGWYPIIKSNKLKKGQAKSFAILKQRIVVYRSESGKLYSLDSFCPHLGADLGNGIVKGENLQCLFHAWQFNGEGKHIKDSKECIKNALERNNLNSYPAVDKYGYIWVYSDNKAKHEIPNPPGLEGETNSIYVRKVGLKVHPHVLMSNAIDLIHFKTLHKLDVHFDYDIKDHGNDIFTWNLEGKFNSGPWTVKLSKLLFGETFNYQALFAGGTVTGIKVQVPPMFKGKGPSFPPVSIIWGAMPDLKGVGTIFNFLVVKKYKGIFAPIKTFWAYFISFAVLTLLRDDDLYVYPHMRFNVGQLEKEDQSLARFIQLFNTLEVSKWTNEST